MRRITIALGATLAALLAMAPGTAIAKGHGWMYSPSGIAPPGSPFRYQTFTPRLAAGLTVVARIDRDGGTVSRWWSLPGEFHVPAVAADGTAGGLAHDGRTLVLTGQRTRPHTRPPRTVLAVMDTGKPARPAFGDPREPFYKMVSLGGDWALLALSPEGANAYLTRYVGPGELEVRGLDTGTGQLLGAAREEDGKRTRLDGMAFAQIGDAGGRRIYTLFAGGRRPPLVYGLDTATGRGTTVVLSRLRDLREPYALHLELEDAGRSLDVVRRWFPDGERRERTLATVDTATHVVRGPQAQAYATSWVQTLGRAADGREVRLRQLGDPGIDGRLLVFNCRGEACASREIEPLTQGCPDPHSNIYVVPTIHSDPRVAARIERRVDPEATVWLDLPPGKLPHAAEQRLERAIVRLGREVGKD